MKITELMKKRILTGIRLILSAGPPVLGLWRNWALDSHSPRISPDFY